VKRFYTAASVGEGRRILLDGKAVKTPGRRDLALPADALADAVADEWNAQDGEIDPRSMKLTGLANAAIDRVAPEPDTFARGLAAFGESDLLYYRAEGPAPLVARQAERWDPILAWAQQRYDAVFELASGITHMPQPADTIARLNAALAARDPFALAGLSPLVTISGSLLTALALAEGAIPINTAWDAATLDEQWQIEKWGEDVDAVAALANRRGDFEAAARFLALL
jgi:chaperone required for assembly of F1-ATPase